MGLLTRFVEPDIDRHLLTQEGEYVIDEVTKHWVTILGPTLGVVACIPIFLAMIWLGPWFWLSFVVGVPLLVFCLVRIHVEYMDRFVVTNMRVFRVHGVLSQHLATMPMTRILDISVFQPFLGRLVGYGHFTFESAAQDQGLRDIRFVPDPEGRDLTIQRTIQRAGLRASFSRQTDDDAQDGN
ncbi:PH domain-containing protein [Aestuariimicrobium kwangyangense]|uniref:PH domain-containing protein n=1 Tax=Aestuariimicrobium kwangyangense TaxID=396389 RepID=UPI0003B44A3A|nr:PH domain-containing protein [Aestuariimicrobium kwangyangense]